MAFYRSSLNRSSDDHRFRRGRRSEGGGGNRSLIRSRGCSIFAFFLLLCSLLLFASTSSFTRRSLGSREGDEILLPDPVDFVSLDESLYYNTTDTIVSGDGFQMNSGKQSNSIKQHKRKYTSCDIDFLESVDGLVEPHDFNFSKFNLEYVDRERIQVGKQARFGGHPSFEERENSFYARDQRLHCGFVKGPVGSPSTGFDVNKDDQAYMEGCRIVVSSCIFGNFDFLRRPVSKKISERGKGSVCFVMFVDELTQAKLSLEGTVSDERGYIGLWRLITVRNLPYDDLRKAGKVPKFLSHRLFPTSRYSIWIDSKLRLQTDPLQILEYFLWRQRAEYAISNHYDRHCVWEEVLQNKRLNKYNHTAIDEQFIFYQNDGLTKFNEADDNKLLPSYVPEGSFIIRAHTPMSNLFSCLWFNEVDRFTSRDQLSFGYTFLKLRRMNPDQTFHLNMFKDCERRRMTKLYHHRVGDPPPASP